MRKLQKLPVVREAGGEDMNYDVEIRDIEPVPVKRGE